MSELSCFISNVMPLSPRGRQRTPPTRCPVQARLQGNYCRNWKETWRTGSDDETSSWLVSLRPRLVRDLLHVNSVHQGHTLGCTKEHMAQRLTFCGCGQNTEITGTEGIKHEVVIEPDSCIACSESYPEEVFSKPTEHALLRQKLVDLFSEAQEVLPRHNDED